MARSYRLVRLVVDLLVRRGRRERSKEVYELGVEAHAHRRVSDEFAAGLLDRFDISCEGAPSQLIRESRRTGGTVKVTVEEIPQVAVGNRGILIRIRDEDGTNLGKMWIGQATVRWAQGSIHEKNAKKLSVKKFVEYLNNLP